MLQWQLRVVEEKRDLDARMAKLNAFISSPAFGNAAPQEQPLLRMQANAMSVLSMILGSRIESWREVSGTHGGEARMALPLTAVARADAFERQGLGMPIAAVAGVDPDMVNPAHSAMIGAVEFKPGA